MTSPIARTVKRSELSVLATGRTESLFMPDLEALDRELQERLDGARVLIVGGAGSIGSATIGELTRFPVSALHVVDINENGLTELVRDLRGRARGMSIQDFRTFPLDVGSPVMRRLLHDQPPYNFVLNFAALKHVRSEKDAYSVLQMLDTNVRKAAHLLAWLDQRGGTRRYFSVSTDKAANPVNLMGASKRLMEHVVFARRASTIGASSARFANVAFSDGSLLDGWLNRLAKGQPLAVPSATRRYFVSGTEAGQLCLLAAICAPAGHALIPRLNAETHLKDLETLARAVLERVGYEPVVYDNEADARAAIESDQARGGYPLLVTLLDTSGEKPYEEFTGAGESAVEIGMPNLLAVKPAVARHQELTALLRWIDDAVAGNGTIPAKAEIVSRISSIVTELRHAESEKQLDQRL